MWSLTLKFGHPSRAPELVGEEEHAKPPGRLQRLIEPTTDSDSSRY